MAGSADSASLVYLADSEPGIRRLKSGRGFRYLDAAGEPVRDPDILARIAGLVIPPAWTDVWISPREDGHLQATGRDARGRKQYRYHERFSACRDEVKYASLTAFARLLPALRAQVDEDLGRRGMPREKVLATIVWLLDNAMIRIGNSAYAQDNKSFGLTTLRNRHVRVSGTRIRFNFRGKSGQEWKLDITDRRMARIVRSIQELPGQQLFQYIEDDGSRIGVASQDVNDYIRSAGGFTSKHFRTWGGTVRAAGLFAQAPTPDSERQRRRLANEVIDHVAARLGNTRAVCRRCYIHPLVISSWEAGTLQPQMDDLRRRHRSVPKGLDREEAIVLRWLQAREEAAAFPAG